ncbi:MAG: nuclear transport factor 2 family protein [Acidobacteriota bacterium]
MKSILQPVWVIIVLAVSASGQTADPAATKNTNGSAASIDLLSTITELDAKLFEAFNNRHLEVMQTMFAADVEFYHDKDGVLNYRQLIAGFGKLFEQNKTTGLRRDLVKGSMAVYPLKDVGAIQTGEHRFCHMENGREDCGTFKFLHIWRLKDGEWKIARAVSYAH